MFSDCCHSTFFQKRNLRSLSSIIGQNMYHNIRKANTPCNSILKNITLDLRAEPDNYCEFAAVEDAANVSALLFFDQHASFDSSHTGFSLP